MIGDGVRCQNPKCRAKLAEALDGTLVVVCRKCGTKQTLQGVSPLGGRVAVTTHKGPYPGSTADRL